MRPNANISASYNKYISNNLLFYSHINYNALVKIVHKLHVSGISDRHISGNRQKVGDPLPVFELLRRVPPYVERYA